MRILSILSLLALLLLGTNGYAGDIDVEVHIDAPEGTIVPDHFVQVELVGNEHFVIVRDHSGEIIWRQLVDLPQSLQGSALADVNAELANAIAASDSCQQGVTVQQTEEYTDEGDHIRVTVTITLIDANGNVISQSTFSYLLPKLKIELPSFDND
ncbi:hypothetical protein [Candidatus Foliamicus sp.]